MRLCREDRGRYRAAAAETFVFYLLLSSSVSFYLLSFLISHVQLPAFCQLCGCQFHAAFYACHSSHELLQLCGCEPFLASEPCEPAYVFYVCARIVFARRRPSRDYVLYAYGIVLLSVGFEQAKSGADAPLYGDELHELPVRLQGALPFPNSSRNLADVKGIVVFLSSCHGILFLRGS